MSSLQSSPNEEGPKVSSNYPRSSNVPVDVEPVDMVQGIEKIAGVDGPEADGLASPWVLLSEGSTTSSPKLTPLQDALSSPSTEMETQKPESPVEVPETTKESPLEMSPAPPLGMKEARWPFLNSWFLGDPRDAAPASQLATAYHRQSDPSTIDEAASVEDSVGPPGGATSASPVTASTALGLEDRGVSSVATAANGLSNEHSAPPESKSDEVALLESRKATAEDAKDDKPVSKNLPISTPGSIAKGIGAPSTAFPTYRDLGAANDRELEIPSGIFDERNDDSDLACRDRTLRVAVITVCRTGETISDDEERALVLGLAHINDDFKRQRLTDEAQHPELRQAFDPAVPVGQLSFVLNGVAATQPACPSSPADDMHGQNGKLAHKLNRFVAQYKIPPEIVILVQGFEGLTVAPFGLGRIC